MTRHPLDLASLVVGLVFVATSAVALTDAVVLQLADLRWLVPGLLILLGLALVVGAARRTLHDTSHDTVPRPSGDVPAASSDDEA